MKIHVLKTWPTPFDAVWNEWKNFEVRPDDRGVSGLDLVVLRETMAPLSEIFTGRVVIADVGYVMRHAFGLPPGIVVFSLRNLQKMLSVVDVIEEDHRICIRAKNGDVVNIAAESLRKGR